MTYDIMMPIDNRSFTKGKIKLFIKWLLDNGYIHGDNDIRVEKTYMHEYDDEPAWERREIEVESYDDVLRVLESHDATVLNLIFGHSKYSDEYREGYTSGTNELTDTIQYLAFEHCSRNKIEPCIDIYGGFSIGLVSKYSEDLLGEKSGISFDGTGMFFTTQSKSNRNAK